MADGKLALQIGLDGAERVQGQFAAVGNSSESAARRSQASAAQMSDGFAALGNQLEGVKNAAGALAGLSIFGGLAANAIKTADAYQQMGARLKLAVGEQENAAAIQSKLADSAIRLRAPIEEMGTLFTRLAPAIKEAGGSTEDALLVTEQFSKALKISGANGQEAASAMLQFSQAVASGKLGGDEFNSVNEAAPRYMKLLADSLGVTRGELKKLATEGKLTSDVLINSLKGSATQLNSEFAQLPVSIGDSLTNLQNQFTKSVAGLNQLTGATSLVAGGIGLLANNLGTVAAGAAAILSVRLTQAAAASIAAGLAQRAQAAAAAQVAAAELAAASAALRVAQANVAMGGSSTLAAAAQTRLAAANAAVAASSAAGASGVAAMAGALRFLGGPWGIAIGLLVSLGAAWLGSGDAASEAADESAAAGKKIQQDIEAQIQGYTELASAKELSALAKPDREQYTSLVNKLKADTAGYNQATEQAKDLQQKTVDAAKAGNGELANSFAQGANQATLRAQALAASIGESSNAIAQLRKQAIMASFDYGGEVQKILADTQKIQAQLQIGRKFKPGEDKFYSLSQNLAADDPRRAGLKALLDQQDAANDKLNKIGSGGGGKAVDELKQKYESLASSIQSAGQSARDFLAASRRGQDFDKLTEGQKLAISLERQLADAGSARERALIRQAQKQNDARTALELEAKSVKEAAALFEKLTQARIDYANTLYKEGDALAAANERLRDEVAQFGLSESAIADLAVARKQNELAIYATETALRLESQALGENIEATERSLRGLGKARAEANQALTDSLQREIKEGQDNAGLKRGKEDQIASKKAGDERFAAMLDANKKTEEAFKKSAEDIENSLTEALIRGFEGGKDAGKNFADSLKNVFKAQAIKLYIEPEIRGLLSSGGFVGQLAGALRGTGSGGSAASGGGIGGISSAGGFTGGGGSFGNLFDSVGNLFGPASNGYSQTQAMLQGRGGYAPAFETATPAFNVDTYTSLQASRGLGGIAPASSGFSFSSVMPYVPAILALANGQYGSAAGSAIGTAILPGIGTIVGGIIGGLFDGKKGGPKSGGQGYTSNYDGYGFAGPGARPTDADADLKKTVGGIQNTVRRFGSSIGAINPNLVFGLGYDQDPNGKAGSRISGEVQNYNTRSHVYMNHDRGVGRDPENFKKEFAAETQKLILVGFKETLSSMGGMGNALADLVDEFKGGTEDFDAFAQALANSANLLKNPAALNKIGLSFDELASNIVRRVTKTVIPGSTTTRAVRQGSDGDTIDVTDILPDQITEQATTEYSAMLQKWVDGTNLAGKTTVEIFDGLVKVYDATSAAALVFGKDFAASLNKMGLASLEARQAFLDASGGIEALKATLQTFYQNFYSAEEQQQLALDSLTTSLNELGLAVPESRAGFRALIESLKDSGASAETYAKALALSGTAAAAFAPPEAKPEAKPEPKAVPEDLSSQWAAYFSNYYSSEQNRLRLAGELSKQFTALGLATPKTRDEFRALVEAQRALGASGEATLSALLKLGDAFAGISYSSEALKTLFSNIAFGVNGLAGLSDVGKIKLLDYAGGIEALQSAQTAYYENFYSDEQRKAAQQADLARQFTALGLAVPATRAQFRALVDGLDLNSSAGQQTYAALIKLAPAFAGVTDAVKSVEDSFAPLADKLGKLFDERQKLGSFIDGLGNDINRLRVEQGRSNAADILKANIAKAEQKLRDAFSASASTEELVSEGEALRGLYLERIDLIKTERDALKEQIEFAKALKSYVSELNLGDKSPLDTESRVLAAQQQYRDLLAKAQGGDAKAKEKLQGAADTALGLSKDYFGSSTGYTAFFAQVTAGLGGFADGLATDGQQKLDDITKLGGTLDQAILSLVKLQDGAAILQKQVDVKIGEQVQALKALTASLGMNAPLAKAINDLPAALRQQIADVWQGKTTPASTPAPSVGGGYAPPPGGMTGNAKNDIANTLSALKTDPAYLKTAFTAAFNAGDYAAIGQAIELTGLNASQIGSAFGVSAEEIQQIVKQYIGKDIPAFANGGVVNSATLALIGEAGSEAVIPLKNGFVPVKMDWSRYGADPALIEEVRALRAEITLLRGERADADRAHFGQQAAIADALVQTTADTAAQIKRLRSDGDLR